MQTCCPEPKPAPLRCSGRDLGDAHGGGDCPGNRGGIGQRCQLDQPGTVVEIVEQVEGHLDREACLPDAPRAYDGDQTGCAQQAGKRRSVLGPPDEAGAAEGQVVVQDPDGAAAGIRHRGQVPELIQGLGCSETS